MNTDKEVLHTQGEWYVDGHNLTSVMAQMPHTLGTPYPAFQHVCSCDYGYADPAKFFGLNKANAELICKAVNERQALIDSNRELLERLQAFHNMFIYKDGEVKKNKIKTDMICLCDEVKDALNNSRQLMWKMERLNNAKNIQL